MCCSTVLFRLVGYSKRTPASHAGHQEEQPLAGELTGIAAAIGQELGGLWAPGNGQVRLGAPDATRGPLIAAAASDHDGPLLVLAATPATAQALFDEVQVYARTPVVRLPEQERLPYELSRDDPVIQHERERALDMLAGTGQVIVVASWAAVTGHCAGPERRTEGITVRVGSTMGPAALLEALEAEGYEHEPVADRPGTMARHGGIVDVFPPATDDPLRIEYFGDEIDSIRRINLETQRSTERVDAVHLDPVSTATHEAHAAAARLLEQLGDAAGDDSPLVDELAMVAEGGRTNYPGLFEALLFESSALDHLSEHVRFVVDDRAGGHDALQNIINDEEQSRAELERRGSIPAGLPPLRVGAGDVERAIGAASAVIEFERFGDETTGVRRLPFAVAPAFAGKLQTVLQQAWAWARQGRHVVIASQQALRIDDLLREEGITARLTRELETAPEPGEIILTSIPVAGGFVFNDDLTLISDPEIFGFKKQRRPQRSRRGVRSDLLSTIEQGDYLVHADHGIARFGGMVRRTSNGTEREYLELQYADGDRLYVPADNLDAITRYVGPGDQKPALTRLDTQEWQRAKRRVRQAVLELAQDLIDLYAKREMAKGFAYPDDHAWQMEMEAAFPFVETNDQAAAIAEVKRDMQSPRPMDRLLCGDVGYGKTEVAARAAFKAVMAGRQVAVLVPTTVLAEQHGHTFRERMAGFPVRVEVLSRFRSEEDQREIVRGIREGDVDIVVGTHRLLQRDVEFKDVGLLIVDEEQRFGVSHKERLKKLREEVDVLTLSATPIPRTLQMSLVGIRDMSTVMTPPEERLPVRTYVTEWDDEIVREAIMREIHRGGQVYFVHNRVQGIEAIAGRLRELVPEARITIGHGQMREEQLERVMAEFGAGEHDVLVCTTIIESGLDIPNANTIVMNNANQLGLAQLYQLRGRVGRASNQAYAYLLYDRNRAISETAQKRLQAVFEASELGAGFQIAIRDLEIRGAGNLLGTAQSGHIAAVGFELYSKLVAEAVSAIKQAFEGPGEGLPQVEAPLPPAPAIDLPLSAHIPESYIEDPSQRLALYQRIAEISTAAQVAEMQAELADRFGPVPPVVENLLFVALVKSMGRRARVESIKTSEPFIHLHVRDGTTEGQHRAVERLGIAGIIPGPNQVRIDRATVGENWTQTLIRVLRAMSVRHDAVAA